MTYFKLLFVFAFVVIGFLLIYKIFHKLYGNELIIRLDPIYENSNKLPKASKFCFLGDSRVNQWQIPVTIIQTNQLFNYGMDCQTTGQVLQRTKDYFENYQSDFTIIQVGMNDLKVIGLYPEKAEYIRRLTINNIKSLLELCKMKQSTPIFITIIPPGEVELKRMLFWNKEVNKSVADVNKILISYCIKENIQVIDATKLMSDDELTIRKEYQKDCLHLNEKGYEVLNAELQKVINTNKIK
jgi:lysophospholipase L1-like esterase